MSGYTGKIKNSGTQEVKAPNNPRQGNGTATVARGSDLRAKGNRK